MNEVPDLRTRLNVYLSKCAGTAYHEWIPEVSPPISEEVAAMLDEANKLLAEVEWKKL